MVKLGQMERIPGFRHYNVSTGQAKTGFLWVRDLGCEIVARSRHCFQQIAEASIGVKIDSRFAMATMVGWCEVLGA